MNGYFKVPNIVYDTFADSDPLAVRIYLHLARHAAYDEKQTPYGYTLQRGECDLTMDQVSKAVGCSKSATRNRYAKLTRIGTMVTRKATQRRNVISLIGCWIEGDAGTETEQDRNETGTQLEHRRNETRTLSKTKTKTNTNTKELSSADADGVALEFAELWKLWPPNQRKNGKANCLKKFKALSKADREACAAGWREYAEIMTPLPAKHFMPLPATWMNQRRWEDDRDTWREQRKDWGGGSSSTTDYSDPDSYNIEDWE
jgi:hypothetical protein